MNVISKNIEDKIELKSFEIEVFKNCYISFYDIVRYKIDELLLSLIIGLNKI